MADPQGNPIDVRKVIEQSASKTTLQELAKKGIYRVKVLDEAAITRMIGEAVQRIIATKTNLLSETDRAKLVEASRKELDKLVKEFQESKDRAELMEKDKAALAAQIENLQEQLKLQRRYTDEMAKQRYEEGKSVMQQQVDDLKGQLADARNQGGDEARRAQQSVIEEVRGQAARREEDLHRQADARFEEGVKSQQQLIAELQRRISDTEQRIAGEKEAEFSRKLLEEREHEAARREELQGKLAEMNAKNLEMSQKLATTMEDMKKSDEELFKRLTELFTKAIEGVNKKLTDLRLRSIAGGVTSATGSLPGDVEFRPSQMTIEGLIGEELESNLKKMEVEAKTSGKISSALDRLKALRKGPAKPDEKKDEPR
ncbi:MAG: hypothetical protein HYY17_00590 [Planctomycetes bacterium]|nr:hypothetical protein [Planctomycetota bacterium]